MQQVRDLTAQVMTWERSVADDFVDHATEFKILLEKLHSTKVMFFKKTLAFKSIFVYTVFVCGQKWERVERWAFPPFRC